MGATVFYYSSNLYRNTRSFENWGTFSDIPQLKLGNVWSRGVFRPIARERKYFMDYKRVISIIEDRKKDYSDIIQDNLSVFPVPETVVHGKKNIRK